MGIRTTLCSLIAAIVPCTAAARAQARAAPTRPAPHAVRRLAGCYHVIGYGWREDSLRTTSDLARDPFVGLPQYFELTDTALAAPLDGWYALRPTTLRAPKKMFETWRAEGRDSVEMGWSNGYTGLSLTLAARGDTLAGLVERTSDAQPRGYLPVRRPITAARVACGPR